MDQRASVIHIRRACPADAGQLQKVFTSSSVIAGTLQLPHPTTELWQARLNDSDPSHTRLVALLDGVVVGTASLICEAKVRRRHVATLGMAVADSFAGRGVGTALLNELLELADNWLNLLRVELTVFCDNKSAVHLYRKFGFEIEGTLRAYAFRDGDYIDSYSMARLHPRQALIPLNQH